MAVHWGGVARRHGIHHARVRWRITPWYLPCCTRRVTRLPQVAATAKAELSPICAVVGGIVAAEVIKIISGKEASAVGTEKAPGAWGVGWGVGRAGSVSGSVSPVCGQMSTAAHDGISLAFARRPSTTLSSSMAPVVTASYNVSDQASTRRGAWTAVFPARWSEETWGMDGGVSRKME